MTKVLRGLVKEPTFEELINSDTYDFENVNIYSSAALNLRQGFFAPPLGQPDVVDNEHDARHEAVLAQMRAIAAQQEQRAETRRENGRAMFAAVLASHRQNMQEHATHDPPPAAPPPPPAMPQAPPLGHTSPGILGSSGAPESFKEREALRKRQYKPMPASQQNEERQKARQKAERMRDVGNRRAEAMVERYDIDRSPEDQAPRPQMQERYDERIRQRNTPLTTRVASARAASAARSRAASSTDRAQGRTMTMNRNRDRALIPAASAPSLDQVRGRRRSRNDTPERPRGPIATTPRY